MVWCYSTIKCFVGLHSNSRNSWCNLLCILLIVKASLVSFSLLSSGAAWLGCVELNIMTPSCTIASLMLLCLDLPTVSPLHQAVHWEPFWVSWTLWYSISLSSHWKKNIWMHGKCVNSVDNLFCHAKPFLQTRRMENRPLEFCEDWVVHFNLLGLV